MNVEYSQWIEHDLEEIATYIARDNYRRAATFIAELRGEMARLGDLPLIHRLRPDVAPDMRQAVYGRYIIMYRVKENRVLVERVVHSAGNRLAHVARHF